MKPNNSQIVLDLARQKGILRPRDLKPYGISSEYIRRLHKRGLLKRTGRGLYMLPDTELTEHHTLAEACKLIPHAVVCLLSALQFHELTTQAPFQVWLAIHPKDRRPQHEYPPMRFVRFSGEALTEGVEEHQVENTPVRVYCLEKTIADCIKYRNKLGLDVALEALREFWRYRRGTLDQLTHYAKISRVANVMRPYLEAMVI